MCWWRNITVRAAKDVRATIEDAFVSMVREEHACMSRLLAVNQSEDGSFGVVEARQFPTQPQLSIRYIY